MGEAACPLSQGERGAGERALGAPGRGRPDPLSLQGERVRERVLEASHSNRRMELCKGPLKGEGNALQRAVRVNRRGWGEGAVVPAEAGTSQPGGVGVGKGLSFRAERSGVEKSLGRPAPLSLREEGAR